MIDIFVTHYIPATDGVVFNEILFCQLDQIRAVTDHKDYQLTVVYFSEDGEAEADLRVTCKERLIKNDRMGRADTQPSMRNKCLDLARQDGAEFVVLLHNDVRVARGWLDRLMADLELAEARAGIGEAIVSPRFIGYHTSEAARPVLLERALTSEAMAAWCEPWGFSLVDGEVQCPAWSEPTPDGHQLMMWIARPQFFDRVGPCDEAFVGKDYDDVDWGLRALIAGKTSWQSRSALVGHLEGLTFDRVTRPSNKDVFADKWGTDWLVETNNGAIWPRVRAVKSFGRYFSHIFCINLDRRPDRWVEAQDELRSCEIYNCERFSGIYNKLNTYTGCTQSHAQLWRRIGSGRFGERVLIFEDDFKLLTREDLRVAGYTAAGDDTLRIFNSCPGETFHERWGQMLPSIPDDWDLLYLGGGYECAPKARVNKFVIRNAGMLTTHAYAITRTFAQHLIEMLDASGFELKGGPDSLLAGICKDESVKSYTLTPRLFIQRPGSPSDLNPNAPGFPFSMTDSSHEVTLDKDVSLMGTLMPKEPEVVGRYNSLLGFWEK